MVLRTVVPGRMVGRSMVMGNGSMLMTSVSTVLGVLVIVAGHQGRLAGYRHPRRRAGHGNCHRTSDGEQYGKEHEEPDAEQFHGGVTGRVAAAI